MYFINPNRQRWDFFQGGSQGGMRFYTEQDLRRLVSIVESAGWRMLDRPQRSGAVPDFQLFNFTDNFAGFGARRPLA